MRKGSDETDSNPWALGTKFTKSTKKPQNPIGNSQSSNQGYHNNQQQEQQQHKHIPKMKDRNPFSVFKNHSEIPTEKFNSNLKAILSNFDITQHSICEFMVESVKLNDTRGCSNFDIIEFLLSQVKTKEYFRELPYQETTKLINTLINSMQTNTTYQNKDSCIKLIGHILYEQNQIENPTMTKIYNAIQKLCFAQQTFDQDKQLQQQQLQNSGGSGSSNSQSNKNQRVAINCLANMLILPSQFYKDNQETIFMKLKSLFDQLMRKINQNFKSKRFISFLTTVLRALQLSLSDNTKMVQLNDTETIKLYINFYKLLYLGTPFAEKMLNIKLEETKQKAKKKGEQQQITQQEWDEEELKGDSGSFIIDTSEMSSSDGGLGDGISTKSKGKQSPSSNDSITSSDPYQKIKNHASLSLQILLKFKNKQLFNYWYLLFPSFFLRSQTEFSHSLLSFKSNQQDFNTKKFNHSKVARLARIRRFIQLAVIAGIICIYIELFRGEISENFLKDNNLLKQLIQIENKQDGHQQYYGPKDQNEIFSFITKTAKNFPDKITKVFQSNLLQFLKFYLKSYDRKKITNSINILEEWLKNFKDQNLEDDDETVRNQPINQDSPYQIQSLINLIRQIVDEFLFNKQNTYSDVNISILSLLCNFDQSQWMTVFDEKYTKDIIYYVEHTKQPPLLRAASIKLLGFMVYFDNFFKDEEFKNKVYQLIFENSNDTNQNIQIRNSWALANVCCLNKHMTDEYLIREVLICSINYASSNKEKVSSNGIRALGYFLMNIDTQKLVNEVLPSLNKSQILLNRISNTTIIKIKNQNLDLEMILRTKIHAAQTLIKFVDFRALSDKIVAIKFWETMLNSLEQISTIIPNPNDQKYVNNLEQNILILWELLANIIPSQQRSDENYLRKELKIPQYSGMYDEELIRAETEQLFKDNSNLENKLIKIRSIISCLRDTIQNNEEVHVSFGVFDSLNSLADCQIKNYRLLEALKGVKSSFEPTFEESKSVASDQTLSE
ncbi:heat repeat-containing protein 6-like [Stylonychia lemnae]|uniref:Heat repeat-containing protein 6-like n=1 Tax=Stylonychia lemnae TaxID=5949 RepID=A0A078A1R3_STYLE|nr:heat repeat-containing protein 6-like [Stylonychia lemnae]|eukprot:CDW76050.1 heat repeat-containing protein 6-like [Stylonychia lemnae]